MALNSWSNGSPGQDGFLQNRFGKEQDTRQESDQFLHEKDLYLPDVDPVIWNYNFLMGRIPMIFISQGAGYRVSIIFHWFH